MSKFCIGQRVCAVSSTRQEYVKGVIKRYADGIFCKIPGERIPEWEFESRVFPISQLEERKRKQEAAMEELAEIHVELRRKQRKQGRYATKHPKPTEVDGVLYPSRRSAKKAKALKQKENQ